MYPRSRRGRLATVVAFDPLALHTAKAHIPLETISRIEETSSSIAIYRVAPEGAIRREVRFMRVASDDEEAVLAAVSDLERRRAWR